jgi:hypothetical protein
MGAILTISRISLLFQTSIESQVSTLDDDPPNQARNSGDVDKPAEDRGRIASQSHIHQRQEKYRQADGVVRCSEAVASLEELGCVAVLAEAVQGARCNENTARAAANSRSADYCVDDVRDDRDARSHERNDEGRLFRCAC